MPNYDFQFAPKPQSQTSLADMINMANGMQQYQQSQVMNPLQQQKALMDVQQAQQMNPLAIQKAQQEVQQSQIGTKAKQLELDQSHFNLAGNILSGLETRAQVLAQKGDKDTAMKELNYAKEWLKSSGIPEKENGPFSVAKQALEKGDFQTYLGSLENMRNILGGASSRFEANLPQYSTNAAGNLIGAKRATNEIAPPNQRATNINPTNADVSLGSEYAKTLQNRVQASNDWLQRSTEMRGIMDEFKPGAGSTTYAQLAQKLQAIGAPEDLVNKVGNGDLAATQSLQKFMAASIMSAARQSAEGSPFASEVKNFEANNPSVNSDPKTLKRFMDFYDRLAGASIKENEAMAQAKEKGIYNPGTWQADWQRIGQQQGLLPQTPSGKVGEKPQAEKTIVREGTAANGRRVVQYSDGTIGYK